MNEMQTFLCLKTFNQSNIESRLIPCLIMNTDFKTAVCCVNEFLRIDRICK